jgi:hypothetical protein
MRLVAPLDGSTQSICPKFQTSDGVRATENAIATGASGLLADWPEREPTSAWITLGGIRGWPLGPSAGLQFGPSVYFVQEQECLPL